MINVLVTGACGVTSRSVVRSLKLSSFFRDKLNFIGTDVCYNLYGVYEGLYSRIYNVPSYKDLEYRKIMKDIIDKEKVEYAIVIPEPEVLYWSENPFNVKFHRIPQKFAKNVLSKYRLYSLLKDSHIIPKFQLVDKNTCEKDIELDYPLWIRDYSEGTTSGMGSFAPANFEQLQAWLIINKDCKNFMLSEYLPGRNLACFLLYDEGKLIKYGVAERQKYIMSKVSVSKITGNTSQGKLLNYDEAFHIANEAVNIISKKVDEALNGLVVVDLKEDKYGCPKVTEINIRHVAFTSSFAMAGLNFAEAQLFILMGCKEKISKNQTFFFPENNLVLRDVDGLPIYVPEFKDCKKGNFYET